MKAASDIEDTMFGGRLFQIRGAATGNARSPTVINRASGIVSSVVDADRNRRRDSKSDTRYKSSDRYDGASPWRQRNVRTASLNSIRLDVGSQCKSSNSGVMLSYFLAP